MSDHFGIVNFFTTMNSQPLSYTVPLGIFCGYVVTSAILFFYPTILHKKKKFRFRCRHISHRGGSGEHLENTMKAFSEAIKAGTEMLELDVHLTKDHQVVVCHDQNLLRLTGHDLEVRDVNYEDIPPIKPRLAVQFMPGVDVSDTTPNDRQIPLLKDVFQAFPNIPINMELKWPSRDLVTEVAKLIREFKREDITVWGSATDLISVWCQEENPDIPRYFPFKKCVKILILFHLGLLPFVPIHESFYENALYRELLRKLSSSENSSISWKMKFFMRVADFLCINRLLIYHLKRRGIQTYFFVLNEENEFDRAFNVGADGVMTDLPKKLRIYLDSHPNIPSSPLADHPIY